MLCLTTAKEIWNLFWVGFFSCAGTVLSWMYSSQNISDVPRFYTEKDQQSRCLKIQSLLWTRIIFQGAFHYQKTQQFLVHGWSLCSLTLDYCSVSCHPNQSAETSLVITEETEVSFRCGHDGGTRVSSYPRKGSHEWLGWNTRELQASSLGERNPTPVKL